MPLVERIRITFEKNPPFWGSIFGVCIGLFFPVRLYSVVIFSLFRLVETGELTFSAPTFVEDPRAFRIVTSFSFILFDGIIGFIFGKWYHRKQKHIMEQIEHEKKEAAIKTLKELTVSLSHYIINASSIIKGFAQRGNRKANDEVIKQYFLIILEEVDKTIATIRGLEALKEIDSVKYIESGTIMMIDLKEQIEKQIEHLKKIDAERIQDKSEQMGI
jgi:hypothetical protein